MFATPSFIIQISNGFDGIVKFDSNAIPVSENGKGHGFGTRSIAAFCKKNKSYCEIRTDEDTFIFRMTF